MSVELTPNGTRGAHMPNIPRPLRRPFWALFTLVVRIRGGRVFKLTTTGAKSGVQRTIDISYYRDPTPGHEGAWLVIASFGGVAKHPDWYVNMARRPDQVWVEVDGRKVHVRPESLRGEERAAAWSRITRRATQYLGYQRQTDREIPVVRLTPLED